MDSNGFGGRGLHGETGPTRELARLRPLIVDGDAPLHGRVVLQVTPKFSGVGLDAAAFAALAAFAPKLST